MVNKKMLAVLVLGIISGGVIVSANDATVLDEVVVDADRVSLPGGYLNENARTGLLGVQDVMNTPMTQYSITEKTIEQFGNPNTPAISALMNVPSVKGGATMTHNDFSIRGHYLQGASFYLNGIPGLYSQMNSPTNMIESVELISGPNMLDGTQMESNSVAGYVNFVSKKASEEPITRYTQTFTGRGNFGEYIDVGRRFGTDNEWGVRVNGELQNGEMGLEGSNLKAKGIFANIDHKDEHSTTNLLVGYRHQEVLRGMRWFIFDDGVTKLPSAPDAKKNVSFDQMKKEENSLIMALNHKQDINEHISWFADIGMLNSDLKRNISPRGSAYHIIDNNGTYKYWTWNGRTPNMYRYYRGGFQFKVNTGEIRHDIVFAYDRIMQKSYGSGTSGKEWYGNIYEGAPNMPSQDFPLVDKKLGAKTDLRGITLMDNMQYKKVRVIGGFHKHTSTVQSFTNGKVSRSVKSDALSPVYGVLYQPNENISIYGSHTEGFAKGDVVGDDYTGNPGQILDPTKSKENELGVKWRNGNFLTTASYFDIKEAKNMDVYKDGKKYKLQDGEVEYEGFELYTTGSVNSKWNVFGGFMYVNAIRNKTEGGTYDGYRLDGSSRWNGVLGAEYVPSEGTSIWGRMLYNGTTVINQERLKLPSYTTFDLGISHAFKWNGVPTKLSLACYNVTNKSYWMTRSGGNEALLSLPRTFMLTAQFDF